MSEFHNPRATKLLPRDRIGPLRNINGVLNLEKVEEKMMKVKDPIAFKAFLDELTVITGNSFNVTVKDPIANFWYKFLLSGDDMIETAVIQFNVENGIYQGVRDIWVPQRRPKGSKIIIGQREYKELRTAEVNRMLERFETKAKELGYLL